MAKGIARKLAELTVDFTAIITLILESFLNVYHDLIGWKVCVAVNRTIAAVDKARSVTPCRVPIAAVPIPGTPTTPDHNYVVMRAPPSMVMPHPVVTAKYFVAVSPMRCSPVSAAPVAEMSIPSAVRKIIALVMSKITLVSIMTGRALMPAVQTSAGGAIMGVESMPRALMSAAAMSST